MARPRLLLEETVRGEILAELITYAEQHNAIPNPNSFYHNVLLPKGYMMSRNTFFEHWKDLRLDGYISVDETTGAIVIKDVIVKKR